MLIGLYGGTFDPVHRGHTHAACAVMDVLGFCRVNMVLAARPGHREAPDSQAQHRWKMLKLACASEPGLVADDRELHRTGPSYTVTTVEDIRREDETQVPCWILGQDAFATLPIWHRWMELLDFCNLIVTLRPGDNRAEPEPVQALCAEREVTTLDRTSVGQILRVDVPMLNLSATQIRHRVQVSEPFAHLLDPAVYDYIMRHGLYRDSL